MDKVLSYPISCMSRFSFDFWFRKEVLFSLQKAPSGAERVLPLKTREEVPQSMFLALPPRQECLRVGLYYEYIQNLRGNSPCPRCTPLSTTWPSWRAFSKRLWRQLTRTSRSCLLFNCVFHEAITRPTVSHPLFYASK